VIKQNPVFPRYTEKQRHTKKREKYARNHRYPHRLGGHVVVSQPYVSLYQENEGRKQPLFWLWMHRLPFVENIRNEKK
jgi:hypothetical protein